jgi:hypothetical protein
MIMIIIHGFLSLKRKKIQAIYKKIPKKNNIFINTKYFIYFKNEIANTLLSARSFEEFSFS